MKKLLLLVAVLCLFASYASAQTQLTQGNFLLGITSTMGMSGIPGSEFMSLGFSTSKTKYGSDPAEDDSKTTSFNLLPKAGYFVMDNLVVGLEVMINSHTDKDSYDGEKYGRLIIGAGPFVRYYYPLEKVYPFAELETMFGSYKETYSSDEYKESMMMIGGGLGAALPIGDRVTFDAVAGYYNMTWTDKDGGEGGESRKYITGGFGLKMGFSVYLWKQISE